jgi:hypothetical protein
MRTSGSHRSEKAPTTPLNTLVRYWLHELHIVRYVKQREVPPIFRIFMWEGLAEPRRVQACLGNSGLACTPTALRHEQTLKKMLAMSALGLVLWGQYVP